MKKNKARIISGNSSLFLDSLRICAAFTVLYIHAFDKWFPSQAHPPTEPGEPSHAAVIVFFVLSGYVIAYTTISKNRGGFQYAQARLTRLCSVVIHALLIRALSQFIIGRLNPEMLASYNRSFTGFRYILSGLFINEIWFFSSAPLLNIALWSLSFEFWYYAIFGLWFFRQHGWKSILLVLLACLIAGPKILLMMIVWLSGYMAYHLPRPEISIGKAWLLVLLGLLMAWLAIAFLPPFPFVNDYKPFYYANQFITDWIVGIFIAFSLWILPTTAGSKTRSKLTKVVREIADLTFPLYVLHYPLLVLWRCLFGYQLNNTVQLWEAIISVLLVSGIIGVILDKQRPLWDKLFQWLLNNVKSLLYKNIKPDKALVNKA